MPRYISLDTEATGLDLLKGCRAFMLSLCDDKGRQWCWDWPVDPITRQPDYNSAQYEDACVEIEEVLSKYDVIVYHNGKFDRRAVSLCPGLGFILDYKWEDTILLSHTLDSGGSHKHRLKDLALLHLEIDDDDEKKLRKIVNAARVTARKLHPDWTLGPSAGEDYWLPKALNPKDKSCETYCRLDTKRTMLLYLCFREVLDDKLKASYESSTLKGVIQPVSDMEARGVTIRTTALRREIGRYTRSMAQAEQTATKAGNIKTAINLNSYDQVLAVLHQPAWKIPTQTTAAPALKMILASEQAAKKPRQGVIDFVTALLTYRSNDSARKYLQSYKDSMVVKDARTAILYPSFNPTGTVTTRFSSSDPNAQNIGKGKEVFDAEGNPVDVDFSLRTVFGPAPGRRWYAFDYNQLQLRIFAYASKEQSIIDAFDAGWDFHSFVASKLFDTLKPSKIQRRVAKNLNFCLIFGGSPAKADLTAGIPGAYNLFRKQFPSIDRYMQSTIKFVRANGCVYTLGGYRLSVPPEKPYVGTNYIIQGTEGEIVKAAMCDCDEYLKRHSGGRCYMTLQVHDELVFDFAKGTHQPTKALRDLKYCMERAGTAVGVKTPVDCERIVRDYASGKKVKL